MVTMFNTPSDDQWIFSLKEKFKAMEKEQRNTAYIKAKVRQDIISFSMAGVAFLSLYLSGDRVAATSVGMIFFFAFMVFLMPQRKKATLEICILELLEKEALDSSEK